MTDILTMPRLAVGELHQAWLAAIRAFDLDPNQVAVVQHAHTPTITLESDGTAWLECDVFLLDDNGRHVISDDELAGVKLVALERRIVTRPAADIAAAVGGAS